VQIEIITLFPEMFDALKSGIVGRAIAKKLIELTFWNPREFTKDKHRTVDDRPYGGGPGMVLKVQPLRDTIAAAKTKIGNKMGCTKVIYLSPQGKPLDQQRLIDLAQEKSLILLSGRYEGVDQRLIDTDIDEECSIGDYVLSGGELAAMVMIDGITRLLPGALGHHESAHQDSFMKGLLDYPHYTRPEIIEHKSALAQPDHDRRDLSESVPPVLLNGNHKDIERWRLKQALGATWIKRPDLLEKKKLNELEKVLLEEFIKEFVLMEHNHE